MKINNFRGEVSNISAKKEALVPGDVPNISANTKLLSSIQAHNVAEERTD